MKLLEYTRVSLYTGEAIYQRDDGSHRRQVLRHPRTQQLRSLEEQRAERRRLSLLLLSEDGVDVGDAKSVG